MTGIAISFLFVFLFLFLFFLSSSAFVPESHPVVISYHDARFSLPSHYLPFLPCIRILYLSYAKTLLPVVSCTSIFTFISAVEQYSERNLVFFFFFRHYIYI